MQTSILKARFAKVAAASAIAALGVASVMVGEGVASADPKQSSVEKPFVAVGSDTTQDVLDAFTGEVNGRRFLPLRSASELSGSGVEVGRRQIASFRAVELDEFGASNPCMENNGIQIDRPNGSGNGRRALSAAALGTGWGLIGVGCTSTYQQMSGLVDFARSSSGVTTTTGDLTFVPFARDALQWAYSAPSVPLAVSNLTTAEVQGLHTNSVSSAVLVKGGTRIIACRIQQGSGTYESWGGMMGYGTALVNPTLETSTDECDKAFDATQLSIDGVQEHDPDGIKDVCDRIRAGYVPTGGGAPVAAQPNTQCIIGYSVSNWVAQFNKIGSRELPITPTAATGGVFNIGTRDGGVAAWVINGPENSAHNPTYYTDITFGRDVFNVIPTYVITLPGNENLRTLLLAGNNSEGPGSGPAMCSAEAVATRTLLGYGAPSLTCGSSTFKRSYDTAAGVGTPGTAEAN